VQITSQIFAVDTVGMFTQDETPKLRTKKFGARTTRSIVYDAKIVTS